MTSISGSNGPLGTLITLYENENSKAGAKAGTLTKDQITTLTGLLQGKGGTTDSGMTTGSTNIGAILDKIAARKAAGSSEATTEPATQTLQQKAASLMQSVYQTQQTNLFSLIG